MSAALTPPSTPMAAHTKPEKKRPKSLGEHLFNFTTYAGVTWGLNEVISTVAGNLIDPKSVTKATAGSWNGAFNKAVDWMHRHANPLKWERATMSRGTRVLWLCVGGNLLVPVVKYLEDHKGPLVRRADLILEGERGLHDPQLEKAHQEMERQPKQSWGSLIKGRLVVMGLALGLGLVAGDDKSPTTRWLKNTRFDKYSNIERIATTVTRDVLSHLPVKEREVIRAARNAEHFIPLATAEGKAATLLGGTFGFVLVVSGVLSAIFYASSKFFAARHEEHAQRQMTIHELEQSGVIPPRHHLLDAADSAPAITSGEKNRGHADDKPQTTIRNATPERARVSAREHAAAPA